MSELIQTSREGSRLEICLNRPGKRNALTSAMYDALSEALTQAEANPAVVTIIISGAGDAFCSGNDLVDFQQTPPKGAKGPVARFLKALFSCSKIIIASVNGPAAGIGATMLLHCDHIIAHCNASLNYAFVKMALVPEAGSSLLLPRTIGYLRAAHLMLTGDPISASEAKELGLINQVVDDENPINAAREFAARLDGLPPQALLAIKRLLRSSTMSLEARMVEESAALGAQLASPEFAQAVSAFIGKRPPVYR
jgi:enoyl-CoA hydratase/carnithine racemase